MHTYSLRICGLNATVVNGYVCTKIRFDKTYVLKFCMNAGTYSAYIQTLCLESFTLNSGSFHVLSVRFFSCYQQIDFVLMFIAHFAYQR